MKSIMTPKLTFMVGVAFLGLAVTQIQATGPGKLGVKLTAYTQGESSTSGDVLTERIDKVKVTTKDLLALIEEYGVSGTNGVVVPDGAYIEVDDDGDVTLYNKDDVKIPVDNLSSILQVEYGPAIFAGKTNLDTDKENTRGIFPIFLGVRTGIEEDVELQGLAKEKYSLSDTTKSTITQKTSISAKVSGGGFLEEGLTLIEGSVSVKGKQKFVD